MKTTWTHILLLLLTISCSQNETPGSVDLSESWKFSPDEENRGISDQWYSLQFDDSDWDTIDAGKRWEDQGYKDLDAYGWYRKRIDIPADWQGKDVWIKFGAVNDAYELFVNGEHLSSFGEANITFADKPSFTELSDKIKYGASNLIAIRVKDWGNSGGLWRLPVILTTDKTETDLFKPLSDIPFDTAKEGYELFWEDEFNGNKLDSTKWAVRGVGPRGAGFITTDAIELKDGTLLINAYMENDSLKIGAVGTLGRFETTYGYFECRASLPRTTGNWAAFWLQSPGISAGEDPAHSMEDLNNATLPDAYLIDYVKVYKKK